MKKYGFSFSWKRLLGISSLRQKIARRTGIPTTKSGLKNKIGGWVLRCVMVVLSDSSKKGK